MGLERISSAHVLASARLWSFIIFASFLFRCGRFRFYFFSFYDFHRWLVSSFSFEKELKEELGKLHLDRKFAHREVNKGASGGERRKLETVALNILNPDIAFLDEIDSGIDVDALQAIANSLSEFMKKGTAIGVALAAAVNRIKDSKAKSKIIILLTDGVNNSGFIDPSTASELE